MKLLMTLDLQFFAGDKTEKATPKKRQDARKKGQVLKSQDVTAAISLLLLFMFLYFTGPMMIEGFFSFLHQFFERNILIETITADTVMQVYTDSLKEMALIILPFMAVAVVAGVAANFMQFGFLFTMEPMKLDLKKMDPIKGIKKIISVRAIVNLIKSLLKISFIGTVTVVIIWMNLEEVLSLSFQSPWDTLTTVAKLTGIMGIAASLTLVVISLIDYIYEKYEYEKQLKMSKQDIKDEYKNAEGDPKIKSKIKQRQREMAMRRMMQEIPNADVVITNPTHYAIALKYDDQNMEAPKVIAKGTDYIAQKIKLIAKENDVVMVENRPLARAMYDQVEIDQQVPEEFFKAIAEILAYVYRIKRKI
ncbi:flagellar biosynthesis protein FlhB [Ureibacillus chungkukjangi]|uniref:Flagellar biosynthetic protein FlhB n=1 Tax=Ureibacillus chungkukjangi TaxID=1202712 RepID=A0A318TQN7_9BACL|nr:flagellar biosynthesis protein FlhB [Ureibacillus chungkukjangi]MCM3386767.1 flagellar biosynthesis protein FlhB [Ureibacillus chungkukjangi]PYF07121.1 flagellar biosynthetic protein FlhB [Ureibacillus chungkukjangi]